MLCFDAWLNKPTYWHLADTDAAKASLMVSLRTMMRWCKTRIPTTKSARWNFPKFHELLHIIDDMIRFGASTNFCAQRPESLLISAAKQPGRRAQKRHRGVSYELQAAQRLSYSCMIDTVYSRIWESNTDVPHPLSNDPGISQGTGNATFCTVTRSELLPRMYVYDECWHTSTDKSLLSLPKALQIFLCDTFGSTVRICTEFKRDVHTFRCHPCYQSDGPIFDWLLVQFNINNTNVSFPCRLAAVVISNAYDAIENAVDEYKLVVQSTTKHTGIKSVLLTEWEWSAKYEVIDPDTIVGPCFVISIVDDHSVVLEALPLEEWPQQFTKIYETETVP
jgi:hypothetical protein